ncbi:UNVERIFIED_CONTAM: hypothetical protein HDU68_007882 [Siphonaria sp. JEL0065]|nr:hypothetical protein HDU68_007882 [Siphonaria sp. JEL0065]
MIDHQELLEETVASLDNLPAEVRHIFNELRTRSEDYYEIRANIAHKDVELKKLIKAGPIEPPTNNGATTSTSTANTATTSSALTAAGEGASATPLVPVTSSVANPSTATNVSGTATGPATTPNITISDSRTSAVSNSGSGPSNAPADIPSQTVQQQPLASSTTGLDWKTGAEAVEDYPDQKDAFWKIVQMFGDCGRIADEKVALVERAKTVVSLDSMHTCIQFY